MTTCLVAHVCGSSPASCPSHLFVKLGFFLTLELGKKSAQTLVMLLTSVLTNKINLLISVLTGQVNLMTSVLTGQVNLLTIVPKGQVTMGSNAIFLGAHMT